MATLLATSAPRSAPVRARGRRGAPRPSPTRSAPARADRLRGAAPSDIGPRAGHHGRRRRGKHGGTRLVTSIVATHVPKGPARARLLTHLRAHGAEAHRARRRRHRRAPRRAQGATATRRRGRSTSGCASPARARRSAWRRGARASTGRARTGEVVDRAAALARDAARGQVLADTTTTRARARPLRVQDARRRRRRSSASALQRQAAGRGRRALRRAAKPSSRSSSPPSSAAWRTGRPSWSPSPARRASARRASAARPSRASRSHHAAPRIVLVRCEPFAKSHALGVVADIARGIVRRARKGASLQERSTRPTCSSPSGETPAHRQRRELVARLIANEPLPEVDDTARRARRALDRADRDRRRRGARARRSSLTHRGRAVGRRREPRRWLDHLLAAPRAARSSCSCSTARRRSGASERQRFEGRDHVRVELRPLSQEDASRAIARAMLGDARGRGRRAARRHHRRSRPPAPRSSPRSSRGSPRPGATRAPRRPSRRRIQVHLDALEDRARDAACAARVFGSVGWDAGLAALGVPERGGHAARRWRRASSSSSRRLALRRDARVGLQARAHARGRVRLARRGSPRATAPRARRALAREDGRGRRDGGAAPRARRREHRRRGGLPREGRAPRARHQRARATRCRWPSGRSPSPTTSRRSSPARSSSTRRGVASTRARASATPRSARWRRPSTTRRARSGRAAPACATRTPAAATPTSSARLERRAQATRRRRGLVDEEARCSAALARRYAFAGELDARAGGGRRPARPRAEARHRVARRSTPGRRSPSCTRPAARSARRSTRGSAARARPRAPGLKAREATLTINIGFALTTLGAQAEARARHRGRHRHGAGDRLAGTVRHGQMNLLCWAATFGADPSTRRAPRRAARDGRRRDLGSWVPQDRATLGVLFYRGLELLRGDARARLDERAHAAQDRRPGVPRDEDARRAPGRARPAGRRPSAAAGNAERACELAREAAELLEEGSPSLLNEAPVFLALHDACVDLGELTRRASAIARGDSAARHAGEGPRGDAVRARLPDAAHANAGLLAAAEAYDLVPREIEDALAV